MATAVGGCQTLSPALVSCPISSVEQATRIQDLAPIGMTREEAVAKLQQSGISGSYGTARTIYYCDTWDQSDKERWHINVELLFNEQGEVHGYRPDPKSVAVNGSDLNKPEKPVKQVANVSSGTPVDPFAE